MAKATGKRREKRFIERHGLWNDEQREAAQRVKEEVKARDLRQVRISCDIISKKKTNR